MCWEHEEEPLHHLPPQQEGQLRQCSQKQKWEKPRDSMLPKESNQGCVLLSHTCKGKARP